MQYSGISTIWSLQFDTKTVGISSKGEIHFRVPTTTSISSGCTAYVKNKDYSDDPPTCERETEGSNYLFKVKRKSTDFKDDTEIKIFFELTYPDSAITYCLFWFF